MNIRTAIVATALILALPGIAAAQTLYKLIDKNGKVTYVDKPPKDFDGKVIPVEIDTKRNSATIATPGTPQGVKAFDEKQAAEQRASERVRVAQDRVDAAKRALADARENPREGEVARMGNAGGGTRAVPTEEYQQRVARLEADLKEAEAELRKLQGGR